VKYLDGFQIILEAFGTFFLVVVLTSLQKFSVEFKSGPQDANYRDMVLPQRNVP
jgi:hypothetical protein